MEKLVENKYGHGAKSESKLRTKIRRALRPKHSKLGKASIPFDWSKGAGIQTKLIKPLIIEDQGQSSSCGGEAKKRLLEIKRSLRGIDERLSAKSVYAPIAYKGGGTTVSALEKDLGANSESMVPSYQNGQPPTEAFMTDVSYRVPTVIADATNRAGLLPITVGLDMESTAQAIRDYDAVIILIRGQNNGTWLSQFPKPPTNNQDLWGHFICSADVRANSNCIDFYNSWGEEVGSKGIQSFDNLYFKSGYITDVIAFDTKQNIIQLKISILQKLLILWQQLLKQAQATFSGNFSA